MCKEPLQESVIESMAGFVGDNVPQNRHAQERKITDAVKELMAHKFVVVAQTFLV